MKTRGGVKGERKGVVGKKGEREREGGAAKEGERERVRGTMGYDGSERGKGERRGRVIRPRF